ncbi:alkaline phosphatase family protein [Conexibacter woesei]|uniref:alkaline phosphatase family protein n=1 Tax=Conexibacter woesei TaxID=191495 RepID=UPI0003F9920A|nr:alkaline phosphatase family protein [Conexibacter woesei]
MGSSCRHCGVAVAAHFRFCPACGGAMTRGVELPSPRVAAGLLLGMLAFGAVLGDAGAGGASAAGGARGPVIVVEDAGAVAPVLTAAVAPVLTAAAAPARAPRVPEVRASATPPPPSTPSTDSAASAPRDPTPPSSSTPRADSGNTATPPAPKLPPVKHVWVIALTGHSFGESFGAGAAGAAPYLAGELRAQGTLLPWYHAAGHDPAASGVALLGGQRDATGPFDARTQTLPGQLTGLGRTWKAYVEGAADGLQPGDNPCARPPEQAPRNPFLRFKSITSDSACGSSMADLSGLVTDAADSDSAPTFSYVLPGPAHDGSTSLADADTWLRSFMPALLASKAYNDGGLVVVTFDTGAPGDAEAGGGRVGALLLSSFVKAGATIEAPYDPFALLSSIDHLFALDPLGYAAATKLRPFGPQVYAAWSP